jgi:hypothetical protein
MRMSSFSRCTMRCSRSSGDSSGASTAALEPARLGAGVADALSAVSSLGASASAVVLVLRTIFGRGFAHGVEVIGRPLFPLGKAAVPPSECRPRAPLSHWCDRVRGDSPCRSVLFPPPRREDAC